MQAGVILVYSPLCVQTLKYGGSGRLQTVGSGSTCLGSNPSSASYCRRWDLRLYLSVLCCFSICKMGIMIGFFFNVE